MGLYLSFLKELLNPMGWVRSLRKSSKLANISRRLGTPSWQGPGTSVESLPSNVSQKKDAEEELFDLVETDPYLNAVLFKHAASRETLRHLYEQLVLAGAGQWVRGHYVAASAFAFELCLDYLLSTADAKRYGGDFRGVAYCLVEYFRTEKLQALRTDERPSFNSLI